LVGEDQKFLGHVDLVDVRNVGCFETSVMRVAISRSSMTFAVVAASMVVVPTARASLTNLSILVS